MQYQDDKSSIEIFSCYLGSMLPIQKFAATYLVEQMNFIS